MMRLLIVIILISMYGSAASAESVSGRVTVVDGDTIEIHGKRIRLHGIDAPESGQSCLNEDGNAYRCGQISANQMAAYVSGKTVTCHLKDNDRYGRLVAACFVNGQDINERLVSEGWALAYTQYSTDYIGAEKAAKRDNLGVWRGQFVEPWKWRKGARLVSSKQDKSDGCTIKGNISSSGKIYHTPESPWYARTKINTQKGERWFCSEEEAKAAGWRPPKR